MTNFRMPDVLSVALGGGSIVEMTQEMTEVRTTYMRVNT